MALPEVLSIVQAASLVVMQVRKVGLLRAPYSAGGADSHRDQTSMPDIIAWQADAAVGALAVGSVHDAMLSQAQVRAGALVVRTPKTAQLWI